MRLPITLAAKRKPAAPIAGFGSAIEERISCCAKVRASRKTVPVNMYLSNSENSKFFNIFHY